jgi:hypothetical protein
LAEGYGTPASVDKTDFLNNRTAGSGQIAATALAVLRMAITKGYREEDLWMHSHSGRDKPSAK